MPVIRAEMLGRQVGAERIGLEDEMAAAQIGQHHRPPNRVRDGRKVAPGRTAIPAESNDRPLRRAVVPAGAIIPTRGQDDLPIVHLEDAKRVGIGPAALRWRMKRILAECSTQPPAPSPCRTACDDQSEEARAQFGRASNTEKLRVRI